MPGEARCALCCQRRYRQARMCGVRCMPSRFELIHVLVALTTLPEMSLVTTKEAAQILGVTAVRVRHLIADGRLVAEKRGRDHLLEDREVQRFKRHGRRSGPKGGRPPGNGA